MRRALLVANPSASGFTGALHRQALSDMGGAFDVTAAWPISPTEAKEMAADAAADGFDVVVAMGGDGVVHHVANGIARTRTALGIIPAGTTNVLARILGYPNRVGNAAPALCAARVKSIPLAHLATESDVGARSVFSVFAAGMGFDADMIHTADLRPTSKYHFGSIHYARSAAGVLVKRYRKRPANLRVDCDGDRVDAVALLVQVHDPYTYFGRMPLRVTATPGPGLTVLAIESLALRPSLGVLARASTRGKVDRVKGMHVWHNPTKLIVEAEPKSRFQADGELLGATDWLEVSSVPDGLRVLCP